MTYAQEPSREQPEPAVKLRKKDKVAPATPEKKPSPRPGPSPPAEPEQPLAAQPEESPEEIMARISRNMRSCEDNLAKNDVGEGTRQLQRDIIKDIDALIALQRRQQCQQGSSSPTASSRSRNGPSQGSKQASETRPTRQNQGQRNTQEAGKDGGAGNSKKEEGMNRIADLYKDVWGHLPETMRQEMDQYSREHFMARYSELLKQYYATIAEKGHRKEKQP
jgi:hypothetical protein